MRINLLTVHGSMEEQLRSLRQSLQEGTNLPATLNTLNTLLEATTSNARIQEIASFLTLQLLFETISNGELLSLTCSVIGKIFSALPAVEVCKQRLYLELGLQHESEEVRLLCLTAISDHLEAEEVRKMVTSCTVFHLVTQIVGDDGLKCASLASNMILSLLESPNVLDMPLKSGLIIDMEGLAAKSDTVRFRVYNLVVKISQQGKEGFKFSISTGLLQRLLGELESGDVLVQMNCVELLLSLMEMKEGVKFLESLQVVKIMYRLLLSSLQDPLGAVIIPSAIKFYGHIAQSEDIDFPAVTREYPEFLSTVLIACESPEDDTQWGVAVDTLGLLGSSLTGRKALDECGEMSRRAVKILGGILAQGRSEFRVRVLQSFAVFFSCTEESTSNGWSSEQYFNHIHSNILSILMSILKQPFDNLSIGTLTLLRAIARHEWGQKKLSDHPGLLEYLLDRNTTLSKTGKEVKFEVIQNLVNSSSAEKCFGSPNFLKLRKYYREGPFYITSEQAVTMEDSTE